MPIILDGEHLVALETLTYAIEQVDCLEGPDYEEASRKLLSIVRHYFDELLNGGHLNGPAMQVFYPEGGNA